MGYKFVRYETKGRVAYVTIDRPEQLNALHPPANREMREAFTDFRDDPDLWIAILTGAGDRAFSAGNDLKFMAEHGKRGEPYPEADRWPLGGITSDFECWKPIVAAVNGYAMGGGLELAMACDVIVASDDAVFAMPETRVGVVASGGGPHRLVRRLPLNVAMAMLIAGRRLTADEAHHYGLANEVVTKKDLMGAAERWANEIMASAPGSVQATKQVTLTGMDRPIDQAMADTYSEFEKAKLSEDFVEGPRAFAEKRDPIWKGR